MSNERVPFGLRLKEILTSKQRNQSWVSKHTEIDASLISRFIKGERPVTRDALQQLAAVLGMDARDLVAGTDAEARLATADDPPVIPHLQGAIATVIAQEGTINDLLARFRAINEALEQERKSREDAEHRAVTANLRADRAQTTLNELSERFKSQEFELQRLRDLFSKAATDIASLRQMAEDLQQALKDTGKSASVTDILIAFNNALNKSALDRVLAMSSVVAEHVMKKGK